jgi:hypothetical protein
VAVNLATNGSLPPAIQFVPLTCSRSHAEPVSDQRSTHPKFKQVNLMAYWITLLRGNLVGGTRAILKLFVIFIVSSMKVAQ